MERSPPPPHGRPKHGCPSPAAVVAGGDNDDGDYDMRAMVRDYQAGDAVDATVSVDDDMNLESTGRERYDGSDDGSDNDSDLNALVRDFDPESETEYDPPQEMEELQYEEWLEDFENEYQDELQVEERVWMETCYEAKMQAWWEALECERECETEVEDAPPPRDERGPAPADSENETWPREWDGMVSD